MVLFSPINPPSSILLERPRLKPLPLAGLEGPRGDLLTPGDLTMTLPTPELDALVMETHGILMTPTTAKPSLFEMTSDDARNGYAAPFVGHLNKLLAAENKDPMSSYKLEDEVSSSTVTVEEALTSTVSPATSSSFLDENSNHQPSNMRFIDQPSLMEVQQPGYSLTSESEYILPNTTASASPPPKSSPRYETPVRTSSRAIRSTQRSSKRKLEPELDEEEMEEEISTSGMSPLERKRARNRQAAMRCRRRKIERIEELEEQVSQLQAENERLAQSLEEREIQVRRLKQEVKIHHAHGCRIITRQNSKTSRS